jgi:hypothetical protein
MTPEELTDIIKQLVQKTVALRQRIADENVKTEDVWFRNLLGAILNCALADYRNVEIGAEQSVHLLAWGRRNLLELRVTVEYVLQSKENALQFRNDILIDAKELFDALTKEHKTIHKKFLTELSSCADRIDEPYKSAFQQKLQEETAAGPLAGATEAEAQMFREFLAGMGVEDTVKPKTAGQLAGIIQQQDSFSPMNKVCSKLMHRTALSIASTNSKDGVSALIPFLHDSATSDLISIHGKIESHLDSVGIGSWEKGAIPT